MNIKNLFKFSVNDLRNVVSALLITSIVFFSFASAFQVYAASQSSGVSLTAIIDQSLTFTTSSQTFGTTTPGTYKIATTTLNVLTNDTAGYTVSLSGDYKVTGQNNLQLNGATSTQITDQTEWVPGAATTSVGNAVVRGSLINTQNVLAFRVMSASSSNGTSFLAPTWWGASDADGVALYAGIPSSTVQRNIGVAGTGSYSASNHYNTVQYYLNVSPSQPTGTYTAPLTYTAVGQ